MHSMEDHISAFHKTRKHVRKNVCQRHQKREISYDLFDQCNNTGAIDVKMDGSVLEEKSSFKMLGFTFSSKLDWGYYIISIGKTASRKIGALICSVRFLFPEVALYFHKSTIHPYMEYCCHFWAGVPSCYLELLDRQATKTDMQDCWSFTCCFSWTLGS